MSAVDAAIGMMDGAYFVGRKELLEFFNSLLDLKLTKIEETATGAIACQLTELIFPGSINLARINWEARSDYEFVQNYKLLQSAFNRNRVQRHVDVDKLIRAKYQDNLEFCQWLKAFFDQAYAGGVESLDEYDAAAARAKGKGGRKFNLQHGSGKGRNKGSTFLKTGGGGTVAKSNSLPPRDHSLPLRERMSNGSEAESPSQGKVNQNNSELEQNNLELTQKIQELESMLDDVEKERDTIVMDVEKERDFYFGKLRSIEVMLQVFQESDKTQDPDEFTALTDRVFQILYATAEDNLTVNERGEVVTQAEDEGINELLVDQV